MRDMIAFGDAFMRVGLGRARFLGLGAEISLQIATFASLLLWSIHRKLIGCFNDVAVVVTARTFRSAVFVGVSHFEFPSLSFQANGRETGEFR